MESAPFIKAQTLQKAFGEKKVFLDINFSVNSGEFISLLGPSGCGKSTLLRIIAGLESPSSGTLEFNHSLAGKKSFVFQDSTLLPWRNVLDNVLLPMELLSALKSLPKSEVKSRARELLKKVGLADFENYYPAQLSGGMKMRVSLARALLSQPSLLLLDEPFAALDEETRDDLDEDLRSLFEASRLNVFFVTHSVAEAAFLSDRVLLYNRQRPASLLADIQSPLLDLPRTRELKFDPIFLEFSKHLSQLMRHKTLSIDSKLNIADANKQGQHL